MANIHDFSKMWTALLIAFAVAGGKGESLYDECETKHSYCSSQYPELQFRASAGLANEEELEIICPDLLEVAKCFEEYREDCSIFIDRPNDQDNSAFFREICENKYSLLASKIEPLYKECEAKLSYCRDLHPTPPRLIAYVGFPNEKDLDTLCPDLTVKADCFKEYRKKCSRFIVKAFLHQDSALYGEICDKQSTLRREYLTYVDCYKRFLDSDVGFSCYMESGHVYDQYINTLPDYRDIYSLSLALPYSLGCEVEEIERDCGSKASETYIEMLKLRDDGEIVKYDLNRLDIRNEIYTKFLPSINITKSLKRQIKRVVNALDE